MDHHLRLGYRHLTVQDAFEGACCHGALAIKLRVNERRWLKFLRCAWDHFNVQMPRIASDEDMGDQTTRFAKDDNLEGHDSE